MSAPQPALPRLPISLLRATAPWKRSASATTTLPEDELTVSGWRPERERLAEYRALIGSGAELPIAYPQVPVMAMHMDLLSRWSYPVKAIGMVHLGSVVDALAPLPADGAWDLRTWGSPGRHVRSGLEFDMFGEVSVAGEVCWRSRAVYLSRSRSASGAEESGVPELSGEGPWDSEEVLDVPEGVGRAFGRVSGDVNPIHLHRASARLFGFPRAIAHGWWSTARCAALVSRDEALPGRTLEMVFRRPVLLPSHPTLCRRAAEDHVDFALVAEPRVEEPAPPEGIAGSAPDAPEQEAKRVLHVGRVTG